MPVAEDKGRLALTSGAIARMLVVGAELDRSEDESDIEDFKRHSEQGVDSALHNLGADAAGRAKHLLVRGNHLLG